MNKKQETKTLIQPEVDQKNPPRAPSLEFQQRNEKPSEHVIDEVLTYLREHRDTSFVHVGRDLVIDVPMVRKIVFELEKRGKIELVDQHT